MEMIQIIINKLSNLIEIISDILYNRKKLKIKYKTHSEIISRKSIRVL